jgi:O-antigen/teichoic acid export membrane protein
MSSKKKVIENSFFYIFSSLLVKAMGFLLLPFYTLFLTPDEYGVTNLVTGFINVASFIVAFSLYSAAMRFYTDFKENPNKLKRLYGTIISFTGISGLISLILGFIFRNIVIKIFFEGIAYYPIVFIAFLSLIFISLHTMHQSILQGMQQGKKLTKLNIIVFIVTAVLKIVFIGIFKLGAVGFLSAQLVVNIGYLLYMIVDLKKNDLIEWTIDISILKETLRYSIPLMPHNLSTRIASLASRIFINTSGSLAEVGLYSIAMQFGHMIDIIQIAVNKAFQPWFYEMMNKNDAQSKKEAVNLSNILLVFYSLIYMGIGLFSQEVVILMTNDNYMLSWKIIPILVVGFSIKSMYYFYVNIVLFYKQAARKLFIATIAGSIADIILAYILVPYFGMYGSAIAFVLAKLIIIIIVVYLSKLYDDVGYRIIKMLSIIIPSLLFMIVGLYFSYTKYETVFSPINLAYKMVILIVYVLFIYVSNKQIINKAIESGHIKNMLKRKKNK